MFVNDFYSEINGNILISEQQASRFAKEVCGDFNPIHNPDAKRFCVPGDLLFSLVLAKYGLSQHMEFNFSGMVGRGVKLNLLKNDNEKFDIADDAGKAYLHVTRAGERTTADDVIDAFARSYVAFSGHNFPDILVPLMAEHKVMINTQRPLIIYESMSLDLERLDLVDPVLELSSSRLEVNGKRGDAYLYFNIKVSGEIAGAGIKKLVLSGLREYEHDTIQQLIKDFEQWKLDYYNRS
ncbi:MAG: hypothetical protein AMJ53_02090 [Gammaproteobacteria bacterium SG8_11]|nr:MAG: hypothetical protein AMJ53_02090 [Gammaproteobacteria bacterium SG8_11]